MNLTEIKARAEKATKGPVTRFMSLADRFWAKVQLPSGDYRKECWEWLGTKESRGYSRIRDNGIQRGASRVSYEIFHGPQAPSLTVDHLCRNHSCVNPFHLEAVTCKENVLRGIGITATNHRKTKCSAGHPYDASNTYFDPHGKRHCRTCARLLWRKRHNSAKGAK